MKKKLYKKKARGLLNSYFSINTLSDFGDLFAKLAKLAKSVDMSR